MIAFFSCLALPFQLRRTRFVLTTRLMSEPIVFQKFPIVQPAEPGVYWWCACGRSKTQPFCDGAHKGTGFTPFKTEISEKKSVAWCACKQTQHKPFCDGSHKSL